MRALEVQLNRGVLVDHLRLADGAGDPVDDLAMLPELGPILLDEHAVVGADMVLVDTEGGKVAAAEHAEVGATLRPLLFTRN